MQRRDVPVGEMQYDVDLMASKRDIDGLIEALQSSDPEIRRSAALDLGRLGEWRATEPLIVALADPIQAVREAAANALVMVGTPAVEPLIDLLERPEASAGYERPREVSREGLTQHDLLAGPEGIPPEKRPLRHRGGITQHDVLAGPEGIRRAGGRRALEEEEEGLTQHDLLAGPEGIPPEKRTLQHRVLAQHDLLAGPEGVKEHEALFPGVGRAGVVEEGPPPEMGRGLRRAYAAAILGEIADPRAEGPLTRSLSDDDPVVRKAAGDAIVRFREKRGEATPVPPASR
ncbi:heat repeat-containing PBS lyase [Methanoculleus bourgensis MS2]|uniref:Heat repeat-containing PBS lyase n=2 Tax=Methanoculleus bourgensis TaxID=83986 RepID=I7LIY1_METBM|nr:HEAT repeat domain-containing protein [Methanoculleus bourgensis]CCJ35422.1 heat repeat-containing PBS lyase [Methanoculleus bourgensis MS2]